jgi:hypothetical protein
MLQKGEGWITASLSHSSPVINQLEIGFPGISKNYQTATESEIDVNPRYKAIPPAVVPTIAKATIVPTVAKATVAKAVSPTPSPSAVAPPHGSGSNFFNPFSKIHGRLASRLHG